MMNRPIAEELQTRTNVIHGIPIIRNAPRSVRSLRGTGTSTAAPSAASAHRASQTRSVWTSQPIRTDAPAVHVAARLERDVVVAGREGASPEDHAIAGLRIAARASRRRCRSPGRRSERPRTWPPGSAAARSAPGSRPPPATASKREEWARAGVASPSANSAGGPLRRRREPSPGGRAGARMRKGSRIPVSDPDAGPPGIRPSSPPPPRPARAR